MYNVHTMNKSWNEGRGPLLKRRLTPCGLAKTIILIHTILWIKSCNNKTTKFNSNSNIEKGLGWVVVRGRGVAAVKISSPIALQCTLELHCSACTSTCSLDFQPLPHLQPVGCVVICSRSCNAEFDSPPPTSRVEFVWVICCGNCNVQNNYY